ncbi:MAG: T9SS type A sorting domain-containing protein [Candidatus Cloacimonetes bacterium]|jgi:hypothetical protein|nr:T9SS type A sorting domain-containing protein [Candidatus Cloacimonadota bacterium]
MKLFKMFTIFITLASIQLSAEVVHYSQLPEEIQRTVVPDMEGKVLINDLDFQINNISRERELPSVVTGWPVSYTGSNCKNGAIYVNMDADPELEILFGVGTKITALNLDGTTVPGWPVQLSFYIWSSPAAGDIDGDGEMEIVCTSRNNSTANTGALYAFELDGTSCAGFPVTQAGGGTNNVCLADLDADGDMEILVNERSHPQGWVYVYDGDGSIYPGWPQELDYIPGAGISVGDITGDGIPEIVALSYNSLHVYDVNGNILDGFPLTNAGYNYSYSQPIIFDLDGDGFREIIWGGCAASAGAVFAINSDASSVTGWPQTTNYWIFGTVSLGDIDADGSIDVVVGDQVGSGTPVDYIFAWDSEGNDIAGFPAGPTNAIYAQVGIADIDGDDNVELMIDDNNFGFGYDAYNHDGTHLTDWPLDCGTSMYSTTMQIPPVFGDVDNDGDLEIIGAATDIMNWVVECYLWDTDSAWNEDLAYMVIDGVNIQHNGLYDPEESSILYSPRNLQVEDWTCTVSWESPIPSSNVLTGYNVYLDGVLEATVGVDVTEYIYPGLIPDETYVAGVSALYDEGESGIVEVVFVYNGNPSIQPPTNLEATVENYNDVLVTWDLPGGATEELGYHTGYDANGIGTGAAADFICAARFTADELATYYGGWELTGVNVLLHSLDFSYVGIQVYEGGSLGDPGTLIYDEEITGSVLMGEFTNHMLSTPVPLVSGNEYWIGYDIMATADHPAAVDAGPMVPDKGAWMYFSAAWQTLPELGATLDFNWIINGVVSESDAVASNGNNRSEVIGRAHTLRSSSQFEAEVAFDSRREAPANQTSSSRSLAGYYVYRDGAEIADIDDPAILSWIDESLDAGTYEYTIEAYYIDPSGISEPTDPVSATVILNPPVNLTANSVPPNVLLTWDAPNRGIDSYNVYRDGGLYVQGVNGVMFIDINVPTGTYVYNVTAVYCGGWESEFSNDAGGPWPGTDPNLMPLVTVLDGNYPNPFNPETTISFSIIESTKNTEIVIYNLKGQKIKTLVNEVLSAGNHWVVWDGTDDYDKKVSSGVYLYKMEVGNYLETKKMILMK